LASFISIEELRDVFRFVANDSWDESGPL
jgi:hypothetical protein